MRQQTKRAAGVQTDIEIYLSTVGRELMQRAHGYNFAKNAPATAPTRFEQIHDMLFHLPRTAQIQAEESGLNSSFVAWSHRLHSYAPGALLKADKTEALMQRMAKQNGLDPAAMTYIAGNVLHNLASKPKNWVKPLPLPKAPYEVVEETAGLIADKAIEKILQQAPQRLQRMQDIVLRGALAPKN